MKLENYCPLLALFSHLYPSLQVQFSAFYTEALLKLFHKYIFNIFKILILKLLFKAYLVVLACLFFIDWCVLLIISRGVRKIAKKRENEQESDKEMTEEQEKLKEF